MDLFRDDPSVYHVINRGGPRRRCSSKKRDGSRCQNKTCLIDKHFKPVCGVHLNKYDRMVCIAEFRLQKGFCVLRETTMRDELKVFSEKHACPVCLNEIKANSAVVTPCGHFFHQDCLSEWLYKKQTCPLCREVLKDLENQENLYSVLDVLEDPEIRRRVRVTNVSYLIDRVHSYDVAVDLAGFFL